MGAAVGKVELVAMMRDARSDWEQVLAQVGEDRMTLPVLHGGWSVKDTIGHVAFYERWLLSWLEAAVRGQVTYATHRDLLDVDARNALVWEENRDRPLQVILSESKQVFDRLLQLVQVLPESDLIAPNAYDRYVIPFWGKPLPLWECIAGDSYEHYREHAATLHRWMSSELSPDITQAVNSY